MNRDTRIFLAWPRDLPPGGRKKVLCVHGDQVLRTWRFD